MINIDYTSLHNHTSYSLMRGLITPDRLAALTKECGQTTMVVTDHATFSSAWAALKAANKNKLKLIIGCEFNFVDAFSEEEKVRSIILLAKNQEGYKNILTLAFRAYDNPRTLAKKIVPIIDWKLLEEHKNGLICISGDGNGLISQSLMSKNFDKAISDTQKLYEMFGHDDFALELQPHALKRRESSYSGSVDQVFINRQLKKISEEVGCRCVVTTNTYYEKKEHQDDQDVLLAIGSGQPIYSQNRLTFNVPDFYVKNSIEVGAFFARHHKFWGEEFITSLFSNSVFLAERCEHAEWIDPKYSNKSGKELPQFPVKDESVYDEFLVWKKNNLSDADDDDVAYMRYRCALSLDKMIPKDKHEEYINRLNEEYDVLEYHGFSSYMLIVSDFIRWAKDNGIRVGGGRGSVGGSLVAYLLSIHVLDPIKNGLIFARFHNKEKTSFPDIDTDFESEGKERVQEYIRNKYGKDYIAHVSNKNTITPKVYARDIARTFEFGDKGRPEAAKIGTDIADAIPTEIRSFDDILEKASLFAEYTKVYPKLGRFLETIGGAFRTWSTHAGGIIIGSRSLIGLVPLRVDEQGQVSIEYDKDVAEDNGLVKIDILGLSTLDVITDTYNIIKNNNKELPTEIIDFEGNDKKTYDLFASGKTFGVFQMGSTAPTLCKEIKPTSLSDIAHINALMRPSCAAIRSDFIKTKGGSKEVELLHPILERSFGSTYGFGLYEECLMYLAQDVAGWDLHAADRLRKMTKGKGKYAKQAKQWREEFIEGAVNIKKLDKELAEKIWDEVVISFQGYGFNNSHALFYSVLGYETAYLKAHYPLEFLLANLMKHTAINSPMAKENVLKVKDEIRQLNIKIVPPDINKSDMEYKIIDDKTLMAGLNSVLNMGKDAIPEIVNNRPYISLEDFLTKTNASKVRAGALQAMAATGCLDSVSNGLTRKQMFYYVGDFKKKLQAHLKKKVEKRGNFTYPWPEEKEWSVKDLFALESHYLGEGVSGSIKDRYPLFFDKDVINFSKLKDVFKYEKRDEDEKKNKKLNTFYVNKYGITGLKGIITSVFSFIVKKEDSPILGQRMARVIVQDIYGNELPIIAFPDGWENVQNRISDMSGNKHNIGVGMAIYFDGAFQYETEHITSFIMGDILDYQPLPEKPKDLKSKTIRIPRKKREVNIETIEPAALQEMLENELDEDGEYDQE